MKEKIDNEFKPRTWLLGILIFIALVIVVILINKIVLVSKERKERFSRIHWQYYKGKF